MCVGRSIEHHTGEKHDLDRFHPNFEGGSGSPTSHPLPPTTRDNLRINGYLRVPPCREGIIHLQTSISSPGCEPRP
ncbi:hypothetical protein TNCV_4476341 [Trichonephila clavipes]|nr:hypothetical protein TNCV_4476341 [Trichonephila clavipes]